MDSQRLSPKQPNIVFIFSDQQRYDTMKCYGNNWIKTPHLNSLADESFVFENAYVTQPVCAPARASIMTGLYPPKAGPVVNRIPLPKDKKTIAEMITQDYKCAYFGKWHLGEDTLPQHGFTEWRSVEDNKIEDNLPFSSYHNYLLSRGYKPDQNSQFFGLKDKTSNDYASRDIFSVEFRASLPVEDQMASFLGREASEFIDNNKDEPFILYVSTFEPHSPYSGPLNGLYDPEKLPVGPSFLKKPEGVSEFNRVRSEYFMQYLEGGDISSDSYMQKYLAVCDEDFSTEKGWKEARANYFANITLVDNMVGDIISSLENNNISENTIVVFTSEHGEMMGDHGLLEKRALYEEASRVPLLFKVPWLNNQQKMIDGSISHIDLVPTLMDLIGEDLPDHLQGKSRKGVFEGTQNLDDNKVVVQWNGTGDIPDRNLGSDSINSLNASPWRSIISERLKLNLCATDKPELFDLNLDKFEQENVFNKDEYRDSVSKLFESILQWQKDAEDSVDLPNLGNN